MSDKIKKNWSFAETKALILAYRNRQEELATTLKKRFWESVLTDLESMDVLESITTAEHVEIKWRSLWRSYKSAKDRGTGQSTSKFLFLDLMDEMFSSRPTISSSHSRSVGVVGETLEPVHPSQLVVVSHSEDETSSSADHSTTTTSPVPKRKRKSNSDKLNETKIKYYEQKIKESKDKIRLLETYIKNKEAAEKERHVCPNCKS